MLVKLRNSQLLFHDPSKRFARTYGVPEQLWVELWKRYKVLEYSVPELVEYFNIKSHKSVRPRQIKRWLFLTEVFILTKPAREKGALVISTDMFGKLERKVIDELTRGMRECGSKKSNIIV